MGGRIAARWRQQYRGKTLESVRVMVGVALLMVACALPWVYGLGDARWPEPAIWIALLGALLVLGPHKPTRRRPGRGRW